MHGKIPLFMALALTLGLAASAQARTGLFLFQPGPAPGERFTLTLVYDLSPCAPEVSPVPDLSGHDITFHGTFNTGPVTPDCQGVSLIPLQADALPAGTYTARVVVSGLEVASLEIDLGVPVPPLRVTSPNPTNVQTLHLAVSGSGETFCRPHFSPLAYEGSDLVLRGESPPFQPGCAFPWSEEVSFGPLPVGTYQVKVFVGADLYASESLVVTQGFVPASLVQVDPQLPTTGDRVTAIVSLGLTCPVTFGPPFLDDRRIILPASFDLRGGCTGPFQGYFTKVTFGPLPAGSYIIEADANGVRSASQGITVTAPTTELPLVNGRFAVTVDRGAPAPAGAAFAVPFTSESGYFWFFTAQNIEVTVKILDGRLINGHYWLFAASMTDLPFVLKVVDLESPLCGANRAGCPVKTYTAAGGANENFIDLGSL